MTEAGSVVLEIARARLGTNVRGKWTLDGLLGVGGMAAVYSATHRNGARVAIKMLHPMLAASSLVTERFVREGYVANKVEHPGVVRVIDDDVAEDGSAFLVMDLVLGRTLAERALDDLLEDAELLDVAEQLLDVLVAAHAKGVVHRDLKPENLLVDTDGKIHVLDFGIARLLEDASSANASASKTGQGAGTPGFMAPEQVLGHASDISARTDLYAVGATLFALSSGDFVHAAESPQELAIKVATEPARSLGSVAPRIAPDLVALVDRATRTSPADRFPDARTMLAEVKRIRTLLGLSRRVLRPEKARPIQRVIFAPSAPTPPGPPPRRTPSELSTRSVPAIVTPAAPFEAPRFAAPRRRLALLAVSGALVIALGIGGTLSMTRPRERVQPTLGSELRSPPASSALLPPVPDDSASAPPAVTPSMAMPSASPSPPRIPAAKLPWAKSPVSKPAPRPKDSLGY